MGDSRPASTTLPRTSSGSPTVARPCTADRDTVMGHEFVGEVVGHGPDCSGDFPLGTRVTSLPIMIRHGEEPLVIGHNPDAPGAFGGLMLVSEIMARKVPDGVSNDSVALVDAFAVGEFYVRCSGIGPGELPLVIGAGANRTRELRKRLGLEEVEDQVFHPVITARLCRPCRGPRTRTCRPPASRTKSSRVAAASRLSCHVG